jgi:hypothetical protein
MLWLQEPQTSTTTLWQTTWDATTEALRWGRSCVGLGWSLFVDVLYMANVICDTYFVSHSFGYVINILISLKQIDYRMALFCN